MSSEVVAFESAGLPAFLKAPEVVAAAAQELTSGGLGFPSISIKGKVFHLVRGDERTLITKPGDEDDEPASSIEVVIVRGNTRDSKTWYASTYAEGAVEKPDCASDDGITPNADIAEPQSTKCNVCPHNAWGSRISDNGGKGKACGDFRRLAVARPDALDDPMLIRVPAASLKTMTLYGDLLKKRGVPMFAVTTKIGFDYAVAHPALTFKAVGYVSEKQFTDVNEARESDLVTRIIGLGNAAAPKPDAKPEAEAKPAAKTEPKTPPAEAAGVAQTPATPKASKAPKPPATPKETPAPVKAAAKEVAVVETGDDLDAAVAKLLEDDDD